MVTSGGSLPFIQAWFRAPSRHVCRADSQQIMPLSTQSATTRFHTRTIISPQALHIPSSFHDEEFGWVEENTINLFLMKANAGYYVYSVRKSLEGRQGALTVVV
jgi:hypothetical protein